MGTFCGPDYIQFHTHTHTHTHTHVHAHAPRHDPSTRPQTGNLMKNYVYPPIPYTPILVPNHTPPLPHRPCTHPHPTTLLHCAWLSGKMTFLYFSNMYFWFVLPIWVIFVQIWPIFGCSSGTGGHHSPAAPQCHLEEIRGTRIQHRWTLESLFGEWDWAILTHALLIFSAPDQVIFDRAAILHFATPQISEAAHHRRLRIVRLHLSRQDSTFLLHVAFRIPYTRCESNWKTVQVRIRMFVCDTDTSGLRMLHQHTKVDSAN